MGTTRAWDHPPFHRNIGRLVLGCIDADVCKEVLLLQRYSISKRAAHFCAAPNSTLNLHLLYYIVLFGKMSVKFPFFKMLLSFHEKDRLLLLFSAEMFIELCWNCGKFQIITEGQ